MKKQKYYLAAGVLACSAISGLAMPLANTFAEGTGSQTRDVTVGEVDETVYSVDINWGDMTFDWKYNEETNKYGFKAHLGCEGYVAGVEALTSAKNNGILYSDSACSTLQTGELISGTSYYEKTEVGGKIRVVDSSVNGRVKARASFSTEDDYDWVIGKLASTYTLTVNTGEIEYGEDLVDGLLPARQGLSIRAYDGYLHLEKDDSQVSAESISTSDKIGTLTITIEPDLN